MKNTGPAKKIPNTALPFPEALRELMAERRISFRRLATRTKLSAGYLNHLACGSRPVPSDAVIRNISRSLRVKPEYFFEYRQRGLLDQLERSPNLIDKLYDYLVADKPMPRDLRAAIDDARKKPRQ